jgi:hypothetical protein
VPVHQMRGPADVSVVVFRQGLQVMAKDFILFGDITNDVSERSHRTSAGGERGRHFVHNLFIGTPLFCHHLIRWTSPTSTFRYTDIYIDPLYISLNSPFQQK